MVPICRHPRCCSAATAVPCPGVGPESHVGPDATTARAAGLAGVA
jgi:hypothetical protein